MDLKTKRLLATNITRNSVDEAQLRNLIRSKETTVEQSGHKMPNDVFEQYVNEIKILNQKLQSIP